MRRLPGNCRAAIAGGLGLAPSAELGERHGPFQPSHGTAPQLAGQGIANPLATILSAAMMLEWLADRRHDSRARVAAQRISAAVERVLAAGRHLPADLGGRTSTRDVARAVVDELDAGN